MLVSWLLYNPQAHTHMLLLSITAQGADGVHGVE